MPESCNSRHLSRLMKSCFPNPQQQHYHQPTSSPAAVPTAISSLPDDLLLECLSRVPNSSLPSLPLVCRRWARLVDSSSFTHLRRRHHLLRPTLFAISISENALLISRNGFNSQDASSKISTFLTSNDVVGSFLYLFSHSRLASIGRRIYVVGRSAMLQLDTWTGTTTPLPGTLSPRKKFATVAVGGKLYVAGGCPRQNAVEEYDPTTKKWRVVSHAPRRRYGCIGACVDGVFYIIGGLKIGGSGFGSGSEGPHVYASSMDLYDVASGKWLRSRAVPGGGCVVAACSAGGHLYVLSSHAVELSFWRYTNRSAEWCRIKSPPLPAQVRLDNTVRFCCVGVGDDKVALVQVSGCIDDLLRRSGRSERGMKGGLVLVYDCAAEEWWRGADFPEVMRRAACVCVEC